MALHFKWVLTEFEWVSLPSTSQRQQSRAACYNMVELWHCCWGAENLTLTVETLLQNSSATPASSQSTQSRMMVGWRVLWCKLMLTGWRSFPSLLGKASPNFKCLSIQSGPRQEPELARADYLLYPQQPAGNTKTHVKSLLWTLVAR